MLEFGMDFFDHAAFREAMSGPGVDTRNFISYGVVEKDDGGGQHSVSFNDPDGNPLPEGVLVVVKLQPSGVIVRCRVAMANGGSGEAEYSPLGPGDEVLVAIPDGDERNGCAIFGRFANTFDAFPQTVSGMDVTQNSVAFKRMRVPYLLETASSYSVRQSLTGASLTINPTGDVLITSGDGHTLAMNSTVLAFEDASGLTQLQIDPAKEQILLFANTTQFVIDDQATALNTSGTVAIATSGNGAFEHVLTVEAFLNFMVAFMGVLGGPSALSTWKPVSDPSETTRVTQLLTAIPLAAVDPLALIQLAPAIIAGLAVPKIPGVTVGIGCPGFLVG